MTGAIIFQLFFPTYMGSHSGYGISIGWQREIGIWNVTVLVILITVNLQVRLVLFESCSNGFDYWRSWDWDSIISLAIFNTVTQSTLLVHLKIIF